MYGQTVGGDVGGHVILDLSGVIGRSRQRTVEFHIYFLFQIENNRILS